MTTTTLMGGQATRDRYHTDEYNNLVALMQRRFDKLTAGATPVFQTAGSDKLWEAYINSFPVADRQYHTCSCCRHFITRFGGLVVIDEHGTQKSALWPSETEVAQMDYYGPAATLMRKMVKKAKVTSLFVSSEDSLGMKEAGGWTHFAVIPNTKFHSLKLTANQKMAETREDYINMKRALAEFSLESLTQMMRVINSNALYRSAQVEGPGKWLHDLKARISSEKVSKTQDNILWQAIGSAPPGFCHPRSSMIGTLLDDIKAGYAFDDISRRFATKMLPTNYQRPKAAPSEGNIANAEKLIAKLGITNSLRRRHARAADIREKLWEARPAQEAAKADGVFGHLRMKGYTDTNLAIPPQRMTWAKFQETVLPGAEQIDLHLAVRHARYPFCGLLTAADPNAPPILKWDSPDQRNPVSWYLYSDRNTPENWGLVTGDLAKVTMILPSPATWGGRTNTGYDQQAVLVIEGAIDRRQASLCLFPEILKNDLHEVRATIEAHSNATSAETTDEPQVCGLMLQGGLQWNHILQVTSKGVKQLYLLDRWD